MSESIPPRYAHIIFCEDVRQEASGQISLVGVFRSHFVNVPMSAPIQVPQIVASIQIVSPKTRPIESVKATFHWRDTVLQSAEAPPELLASLRKPSEDPEAKRSMVTLDVKAGPLHLDGDGAFKVTVEVDGEVLNYAALRFRFREPQLA